MPYPLPVFHFSVDWGGTRIAFSEVTGLNIEAQIIEYRDGASPEFSTVKMPGLKKYGNITLKRGVFASDNEYFDWFKTVHNDPAARRDITISLLNENHAPVMNWKVVQAWPTKLTSPDMKASGNEAAIETLELAHEGVTIENP
jgi:phage tail-like protein